MRSSPPILRAAQKPRWCEARRGLHGVLSGHSLKESENSSARTPPPPLRLHPPVLTRAHSSTRSLAWLRTARFSRAPPASGAAARAAAPLTRAATTAAATPTSTATAAAAATTAATAAAATTTAATATATATARRCAAPPIAAAAARGTAPAAAPNAAAAVATPTAASALATARSGRAVAASSAAAAARGRARFRLGGCLLRHLRTTTSRTLRDTRPRHAVLLLCGLEQLEQLERVVAPLRRRRSRRGRGRRRLGARGARAVEYAVEEEAWDRGRYDVLENGIPATGYERRSCPVEAKPRIHLVVVKETDVAVVHACLPTKGDGG